MLNLDNELKEIIESYFDTKNVKDIFITIKLTKRQAKAGTIKQFQVNRRYINNTNKDYFYKNVIEKIDIPKNTKNGVIFELKQKGNQCKNGEMGNLYVKVHIFGEKIVKIKI